MLRFLNYYILQWFFIRLARKIDDETEKQVGWTIIRVLPLSGYNGRPFKKW